MKIFCLSLFLNCFIASIYSQPYFQWVQKTEALSVVIKHDASGNVITAGTFSSTTDFDPGPGVFTLSPNGTSDVFISKTDPLGNFIWAKQLNAVVNGFPNAIVIDGSGNILATGGIYNSPSYYYNAFVWKMNASGNTLWLREMGGSNSDNGNGIAVDAIGNVYTCGVIFSPDADFDPGPGSYTLSGTGDGYICKLSPFGNFIWARAIIRSNTSYLLYISSLCVDNTGIYYAGEFSGTADFDPGPSTFTLSASFPNDAFVAKLNDSGSFLWAGSITSDKQDGGTKVKIGANDVYLAGRFDSIADLDPGPGTYTLDASVSGGSYIMKMNASGQMMWVKTMFPDCSNFALDASENIYLSGFFNSATDFDPGPGVYTLTPSLSGGGFINKLDSVGEFQWAIQLQDTGKTELYALTVDPANNIYVSGLFSGRVDFDPGPLVHTLTATGVTLTPFILKLGPSGVGLKEHHFDNSILVYPNPCQNEINVSSDALQSERAEAEVINSLGQTVFKTSFVGKISVVDLLSGCYTLKVTRGSRIFYSAFIKQ